MDTTQMVRMAAGDPGGGERVLFIEDSPTLAQLLEVSLLQAGYQVVKASSGEEGLELAREDPPDLLLCDVMLPGIDGFEVVRQLRRELTTANMSIIMLTAMANVMEGLDAGADDYVLKPYDHRELLARVRSVLRRAKAMRALSPLTGLPGNTRIQEELERAITEQRQFALLYADLDNFKAYNDHYGFARGDDILRLAARLLHGAVQATARPDAFVGHVGGDDFVAITAEEAAKAVVEDLIERFDGEVPSLYDPEDAERGWIEVETAAARSNGSPWSRSRSGSPRRPPGASATTPRRSPPPPR
jgi:PleD family two-component response regulator